MKRDVVVNNTAAHITVDEGYFTYRHAASSGSEGGEAHSVSGGYSIHELTPGCYSVLLDGRSYRVCVGGAKGEVLVNGRGLEIDVFDPRDLRSGNKASNREGRQIVASQMPGKVVRVLVSVGDEVEQGQGVVVVEAMKMQNEMKSPKTGRIVEVRASADDIVAAGDVLLVVE